MIRPIDHESVQRRYFVYLEQCVDGDDARLLAEEDEVSAWLEEFIASQPVSNGGSAT